MHCRWWSFWCRWIVTAARSESGEQSPKSTASFFQPLYYIILSTTFMCYNICTTGVDSVEVDVDRQKVTVTGYVDRWQVLKAVRRAGRKAEFWPYPYDAEYYPYAAHYLDESTFDTTTYNYRHHGSNEGVHGYFPGRPYSTVSDDAVFLFSDDNRINGEDALFPVAGLAIHDPSKALAFGHQKKPSIPLRGRLFIIGEKQKATPGPASYVQNFGFTERFLPPSIHPLSSSTDSTWLSPFVHSLQNATKQRANPPLIIAQKYSSPIAHPSDFPHQADAIKN
ncbi:hypothetical protein SAY87_018649 [Trapa incisa]|uniref:HMA domain-containing protein n=1 Tax=Trapa incisa TaxID=236973 RepID=A0AAN7JXY6_9MYRT|nr:hypothetical protein SAY87_018649 [Trapa incisa]